MRSKEFGDGYLIRLERGERVAAVLEGFLQDQGIRGGTVTGLGGIADAELGFFDLPTKTYQRRTFSGNLELIHYFGNIALLDGKPFIHAHAVVSGPDFTAWAGHFFDAKVAITGEFVIRAAQWEVERTPDEYTGLNLLGI